MSTSRFRRVTSGSVSLALVITGMAGRAQNAPGADVHIELRVTRWPAESGRTTLRPRDFVLSENGRPVPFHLTRPEDKAKPPVHLLLLSSTLSANALWTACEPSLTKAWGQGWSVSIAGADRSTPYVQTAAALAAALVQPAGETAEAGSVLQRLATFAGRQILVVTDAAGMQFTLPAPRSLPETYIVDGGLPGERSFGPTYLFGMCNFYGANSCPNNETYFAIGNPQISPAVTTSTRRNGFKSGVWHGDTLRAGIREALQNSPDYFELRADVPAAALGYPFHLQLRKLPAGLSLKAEAYTAQAGLRATEQTLLLSQQ